MGIGGLTSFIDVNPHLLTDHELHDSRVIMDGNNLSYFIYYYYNLDYLHGGNYGEFVTCVRRYFAIMEKCRYVLHMIR